MNPNREEILFELALEKPALERASWLDRECGEDQALRQRLDAPAAALDTAAVGYSLRRDELHESQASSQGLTELGPPKARPEVKATMKLEFTDVPDESIGQKIGRYKVLERVGEGGCGAVYVAEQTEPVRRGVVLKATKPGMDTRAAIAPVRGRTSSLMRFKYDLSRLLQEKAKFYVDSSALSRP